MYREVTHVRVAEFFAGIGLVRLALETEGAEVVWANDIEPIKQKMYVDNFGDEGFVLGDVGGVRGVDIPDVELATASFPCTDLSLAGNRAGLNGRESGTLWHFTRIIDEMEDRKPSVVLLENVPGLITSRGGKDLYDLIQRLNGLGYTCDVFIADAAWFVPQSRQRVFIIGTLFPVEPISEWPLSPLRPERLVKFSQRYTGLNLFTSDMPPPAEIPQSFGDVVERLPSSDALWWDEERLARFESSLAPIHQDRFQELKHGSSLNWRTAYRRTRHGKATWEIRQDHIAGCLRASRGGSSKQAVVEGGRGQIRVRWMTPREYARLQGVPDSFRIDGVSPNQAQFGFGDAVCVPLIRWIIQHGLEAQLSKEHAHARTPVA